MYGTMEDFENLIKECKKREIKIMLDMVLNHTSTNHQWFKKASAGDKKYNVISLGKIIPLYENHEDVYIFKREYKNQELLVINNFYGKETEIELDFDTSEYTKILSNTKEDLLEPVKKIL